MATNLKSLINRLNPGCKKALEDAAGVAVGRTHFEVDIEHLLLKIVESNNTDFHSILAHYEIDQSRVTTDLTDALNRMKKGNTRNPVLSQRLPKLFEEAWLLASVNFGVFRVRTGHLVLALVSDPDLSRFMKDTSKAFERISAEDLGAHFDNIVGQSSEHDEIVGDVKLPMSEVGNPGENRGPTKTPGLDQYTVNLTQRAREGSIDPVLGRDREIRQMIDILTRRRQNNPILTGEAGVGKTAVVEGLALRIAAGDVPPVLQQVALHSLDLGLLQAGASVKGEFENRLRSVIDEVKRSPYPIIVFIDEAHTLIGAGGQAGQGDAANLLKPALARGEMRTVAATTWAEYKKYFEQDPALTRRFQVVKVEEPSEDLAADMLRGMVSIMEKHHKVRVLDDAVIDGVKLSNRYLIGRQLPDKAVSVLDTACARVAIGLSSTPPAIEDSRRRMENLGIEMKALKREEAVGTDHGARLRELDAEQSTIQADLKTMEERWKAEMELVNKILDLRGKLEGGAGGDKSKPAGNGGAQQPNTLKNELNGLTAELAKLQGDSPLVYYCVTGQTVSEVISAWTGIPMGKMLRDEIATVIKLQPLMEERVVGQSHALTEIAKRIRTARAQLEDPGKPKGVFLLVGTSGVGKTETALALADILYGGERNIITINMSEYQQDYAVSNLIGSAKGLVGYGEGGVLTEAVRRRPHSVVLLDEIEKAHPRVFELFFQVFDKGVLNDSTGREVDFKNTIIILTSNAGTDTIMKAWQQTNGQVTGDQIVDILRPELQRIFKPAFLGRLSIIPFFPISDQILRRIVELKLNKIKKRIEQNHRAQFLFDPAVIDAVAQRCTEVESGARNVDNILSGTVLPEISDAVLARMGAGHQIEKIKLAVGADGGFQYDIA